MNTAFETFLVQVIRCSMSPQYFWNAFTHIHWHWISDLWSLPKQLLLLQPQPLLLQLLQSHLVVASHDYTVAGRQRAALLHRSTLGHPLLVQSYRERDGSSNMSAQSIEYVVYTNQCSFVCWELQSCTFMLCLNTPLLLFIKLTIDDNDTWTVLQIGMLLLWEKCTQGKVGWDTFEFATLSGARRTSLISYDTFLGG